jgi:hypothetical protein
LSALTYDAPQESIHHFAVLVLPVVSEHGLEFSGVVKEGESKRIDAQYKNGSEVTGGEAKTER